MSAFNTALSTAKKLTDNVAVAEIPPRFQPLHANDNIAALNANIMAVAKEMSVTFIPNNTYFFLQSDDINDGYFYDKVHLTLKGSDKLALSMGLGFRNSSDSCSSLHPHQQTRPRPRPRPRPARQATPQQVKTPTRGAHNRGHGRSLNPGLSTQQRHERDYGAQASDRRARKVRGPPVPELWDTSDETIDNNFDSAAFWRRAREKANARPQTQQYGSMKSRQNEHRYCKKCGERNHDTVNCFHKEAIECNDCHRLGHKNKWCSYYN